MGSAFPVLRPLLQVDGNERFYGALVFSLALHVLILALWLPQYRAALETGSSELTAILSQPAAASVPALPMQADFRSRNSERELLTIPAPSSVAIQTKSIVNGADARQNSTHELTTKPDAAARPTVSDAAASGGESRVARKPGEARVVMEIRDDGQVGQLIWDLLPALTDEQFNKLETAIRAHFQLESQSGSFVRQTIDVRDFLGKDVIH